MYEERKDQIKYDFVSKLSETACKQIYESGYSVYQIAEDYFLRKQQKAEEEQASILNEVNSKQYDFEPNTNGLGYYDYFHVNAETGNISAIYFKEKAPNGTKYPWGNDERVPLKSRSKLKKEPVLTVDQLLDRISKDFKTFIDNFGKERPELIQEMNSFSLKFNRIMKEAEQINKVKVCLQQMERELTEDIKNGYNVSLEATGFPGVASRVYTIKSRK